MHLEKHLFLQFHGRKSLFLIYTITSTYSIWENDND